MINWPTKKLGEICEIYQPQTITSNEIKKDGPYKVFGANGVIGYYHKYNHEDSEVLVTCRGATCGTLNFSEPKSWITGNAMVVKPKDKNLTKEFLYYLLIKSNLKKTITGTGQPQITRASLAPFKIPLPSLKIQKQIVERLDAVKKAQELNDKQIVLADELFQSLLHKELDPKGKNWKIRRLKEVAKITMGQSPPSSTYNTEGKGLPFFQGKFEFKEIYPIPIKFCSQPIRIAKKNDVLLSVRAPVGPVNLSPSECCIGRGLSGIRADIEKLNQLFLFYFMKLNENKMSFLGSGSTFNAIGRNRIDGVKIPLPPLSIQHQIVQKLQAVQEYKKELIEQKQKLKELFESTLDNLMRRKKI